MTISEAPTINHDSTADSNSSYTSFTTIATAPISLDIIIVGAGLGGLTAAIGLTLAGHNVTVLEQAAELGEVGAGIQIPPPSSKILKTIGCLDSVLSKAILPYDFKIFSWKSGNLISEQNLIPYVKDQYHGEYIHVHRADYHRVLVERCEELNVKVLLNSRVDHIDFDSNTVTTSTRISYTGDIIVGYDGIKSELRSFILGYPDLPYNTGDLAYRALIDVEEMKKYDELKFLYEKPNINFWWGPQSHIVVYLLQGGKTCNVVILSPDNLEPGVFVEHSSKEELTELFKDWDPRLIKLFELIHSTSKWKLQNSRELSTWTHKSSNCIILGDASHATLPYLASGASSALEDAAVLTGLLSHIESKDQIHPILELTESLRKWRSTQIVKGSTQCQNIYHLKDGQDQLIRDSKLADLPPKIGYPNRWADPSFQQFLWGYEAFDEAERGWKEFKKGNHSVKYHFDNLYEDSKL
ncbi:salicylate hydroxylase [Scheffersomyces coipomensis]|uniref:salicylate hydroxylase n=1 Tax=Scheffersomyces coipomensis TaxID=1788519 RepID=UPI00315C8F3C